MHRSLVGIVLVLLGIALAGSCALDDRGFQDTFPLLGDGGLGGTGRLEVAPGNVNLGWVATGFAARSSVRIGNTGDAPLPAPFIGFAPGSEPDFQIIQNQCLGELAPGQSCDVRVQLIPSRAGALAAVLRVQGPAGAADVAFGAEGLAAGDLILAPAAGFFEDFGGVRLGVATQGVFSITNPTAIPSGPLALQVNRPELGVLVTGTAGECVQGATTLVNGESCNVTLAFTPSERGVTEAVLTARSDGAGSVSARLTGRGLAPGQLLASSAQLDFAGVVVGQGIQGSVGFENRGDEPLTLLGAGLEPAGAEGFALLGSDCGAGQTLPGGESCNVQLEFRPPRAGVELSAELWVEAVEGEQRQAVALRGSGLDEGVLALGPAVAGDEDFGPVLLASSSTRTFVVQNPSSQPSGVLDLRVSEGFELLAPPQPGECAPGATSLVDGQACSVRVRFAPTRRALVRGALTVSSALAGARSLALSGQGIVAAALEVPSEVDFGRVFTGSATTRTLTLENAGDEPLQPPTLALTSSAGTPPAAFSYSSACTLPLASGESCDITLSLTPTQPVPHAANLELSSAPGGTVTVLLLAEALAPGSLVLAATAGDSGNFGDVAIGSSLVRGFSLSNPGSVPSGLLTIRSDSNRFELLEGDCNPAGSPGLADGEACSFSVRFTPDSSLEVVGNLVVQSPGAGQTGLELRGRGRRAADLLGAGNRDLGRAALGLAAAPAAENAFVWTVSNAGDLPSGTLAVTNDNPTEFVVTSDTCSTASVAGGGGSCTLGVRFQPGAAGLRSATLVVSDSVGGDSVSLVLTGTGFQLAQPGQSCVNAECAAGTCTRGVCCDRACDGICQVCSASGVCADQSGQEQCGGGSGRCFGVNRCLLPNGQACGQGSDCGNGNCEQRLGGTGPADRICCQTDCDAIGQQCNAQGVCQQPALAEGATCGAAGDAPCGAGLECKACRGGGNRCTPSDQCCGGCAAGYVCIGGDSCGCDILANGQRGIDCGGGLCIQNRADACCPQTPACSPARPNCDPADNLCKQCVTASQCAGTNRACNGGVCACAVGNKDCGGGNCIPNNACCEDCAATGRICSNGTCGCPGGAPFVNGQCGSGLGTACASAAQCQSGNCVDGVCCESACTGPCTQCQAGTGRCVAPADDAACPSVDCGGSTCQPGVNITANRCLGVGQCKTAANCTTSNAAPRTACGAGETVTCGGPAACAVTPICDGAGNCGSPTIACGGVPNRTVGINACCDVPMPIGEVSDAEAYISDCESNVGGSGHIVSWCDSQNDCPNGSICCAWDFGNFNSMACTTSCPEDATNEQGAGTYRVCRSPGGGTSPCPNGRACTRTHPELPTTWGFCAL